MTEKFFDSVSFWQRAYEQAEAGQSKLREELHELKQSNEAVLARLRAQGAPDDDETSLASKRKVSAVGKNANSANVARKRTKLPQKTIPLLDDDDSEDSEEEGIRSSISSCSKMTTNLVTALCLNAQLHTLQKALQRKPNSNSAANSLAIQVVTLCKAAEQKLIQTVMETETLEEQKSSQTKEITAPNIDAVINGVTIAFHLAHKALCKLAGTGNGVHHQGQVTYYLVGLFESTMTALTLHCTAMSKENPPTTNSKPKNLSEFATEPDQQNKNTKLKPSPAKNETASRLADLLCTMALSLDLNNPTDQEVMEGFLFLVLTRLGRMLALHVFHDIRLPMGICPGMTFPEGLEKMTDEGLMPSEAQLEAKYLARLLERMLDTEPRQSTSETSASRQFVTNAKDRLQNTLLRAVFGPDESLFRGILRRPQTPPPLVLDSEQMEQKRFADWLTQELWRIVGWDVLKNVFVPT
jgi:hypothetical protein